MLLIGEEEMTPVRVIGILILAHAGFAMGCDSRDDCVLLGTGNKFGTDLGQKMGQLSEHAKQLNLEVPDKTVAYIVGAAYAASQIEGGQDGVPVNICLRSTSRGETEYQVSSRTGKMLSDWRTEH